jgi:hypothetical protein
MSTQKRRIVYFTDEAWAALKVAAADHGQTISAYIRHNLVYGTAGGSDIEVEAALEGPGTATFTVPSDVAYREFRPVPKPGKGK